MREIKFRAYVKDIEVRHGDTFTGMCKVTEWRITGNIKIELYDDLNEEYYTQFLVSGVDKFTVLNFIGLQDKKNVEIYEGDIIKFSYFKNPSALVENIVEFTNGCFNVQDSCIQDLYHVEVVGNIYENPS